jgi:2-polyprenyl-6-methoxyphenol hydroxylase-like FAD-dependent oxidoreductase
MPLEIIIAGAGIAGLSSAIDLARRGHLVNVYERRYGNDGEDESVGAVRLQPNAVKILWEWGALEIVDEYTHDSIWTDVRVHSGETLLLVDMASRGGTRTGPRGDFRAALQKFAIR